MQKIRLLPKKERSLKLFHPWVFSGAIADAKTQAEEGEPVEVYSHDDEYLATGHYHNGSIKIRVFSFEKTDAGNQFWENKIRQAYAVREKIGLTNNTATNAYRLVNGEGDGMPGVIIDVYKSAIVLQIHTLGMYRLKESFHQALKKIYGSTVKTIFDKSSETLSKHQGFSGTNSFLTGEEPETEILENGIAFRVNWLEGQKTGFFLDQRENRQLLQRYSESKKVLNAFSYSGGFSMYALKGGAESVHSVDSSAKAGKLAEQNARLNEADSRHTFFCEDVFEFLKKNKQEYDLMILDPPAFAKHLSAVKNAMVGYRSLNFEGIRSIKPGGILFTFSCSQVIDRMLFRKLVFQAAAQAKRNVRILHQLSQAPDHAISMYHPEGEYLKGLVLIVD